ncbi:MAG: hypothetical protein JSR60_19060 [Proteobacteria bacterium]|nr:hypothetical protein [Pseudomonadota bacterium]
MLRAVLLGLGGLALVCGLIGLASGVVSPMLMFGIWGALLVLGILCERVIYKPIEAATPGAGWQRTSERFIDDETGRTVTVFVEPKTGERAYVQD